LLQISSLSQHVLDHGDAQTWYAAIRVQWRQQWKKQLKKQVFPDSWLRVSGTTKTPQIDHGVGHQLHAVMALLFELEAQQQPFEFILPREGSLHA
jgi:hypothetical protein